jgi:hypothetical protein
MPTAMNFPDEFPPWILETRCTGNAYILGIGRSVMIAEILLPCSGDVKQKGG